jgi:putative membrane protein
MSSDTSPNQPLERIPLFDIGKRLGLWLGLIAGYFVAVELIIEVTQIRLPDWSAEAEAINALILGLLLSFRNRSAYERWWEGRRLWGQLINDCRNLACQLAALVPAEALARSPVAALLAGFPEALKRHLRGETPRLQALAGFEKEVAEPTHLPSYLAGRLYDVIGGWKRDGLLDQAALLTLAPPLRGLLDCCGGCERIRNTPLSPSYTRLLRTGIVLGVLAAPWSTLGRLGFWGIPSLLLVCFFLLGVELIDSVIEEPFGCEREDLALDRYCATIRESVSMILPSAGA